MKQSSSQITEQWQMHLTAWQASGSTQADYCKQHGLVTHNFWYWKNKLSSAARSTQAQPAKIVAAALIPVRVLDEPVAVSAQKEAVSAFSTTSAITVHIDHRYRIDLMPGFDPTTLSRVLAVLRS